MRYGRTTPSGFCTVHTVCCEDRARQLLVLACPTNYDGEFIATELAEQQTIPNLRAFSERLKNTEECYMPPCSCEQS